ncbi:TVP38/TMEM64 family protein [Mycoplasma sp. P36-A1]|uniref:TVP38/TMEM64 family protein n=1 Tax=Mycoplasma sp. P36-A1 TaxID=3252900 RepID=UPI003C2E6B3D
MREFINGLIDNISNILEVSLAFLASLGLLGAFAMPFLEAIMPMLPLNVMLLANIENYGPIVGFLITYAGSVTGTIVVFITIRYFITDWFLNLPHIKNNKKLDEVFNWVETKGMWILMLLMILPFFPHSLISYACALSTIRKREFYAAMLSAKAVALGFNTYLGESLLHVFEDPKPLLVGVIVLVLIILLSKVIQNKFSKEDNDKW